MGERPLLNFTRNSSETYSLKSAYQEETLALNSTKRLSNASDRKGLASAMLTDQRAETIKPNE